MDANTKQCPLCAEDIPLAATVCEYCGAQFVLSSRGYCPACHQMRPADAAGRCTTCNAQTVDWRVESELVGGSLPIPAPTAAPRAAPTPVAPTPDEAEELLILPIKGEGVLYRWNGIIVDVWLIALIYTVVMVGYLLLAGPGLVQLSESDSAEFFSYIGIGSLILLPVIWFLYFFLLEGAFGTTPGKASAWLRVIQKDGGRITWGQAAVRALLSIFEDNLIGAIVIWATPLNQRIGDLLADTLVVQKHKLHKVEIKPPTIAFEFHDTRRVEFATLRQGILYKFGLIRQLLLVGQSADGSPLKHTLYGHFFRKEFDLLRLNIERRYGLRFSERIIVWRLMLMILMLLMILCGFVLFLHTSGAITLPSLINLPPTGRSSAPLAAVQGTEALRSTAIQRPTRTPPPTPTHLASSTSTPAPVEVTFDTIGDYAAGRLVILVGRLVLMSKIRCRNNECGLLLENPADTSQKITIFIKAGDGPNQLKPVPESYTKGDIQVRLDDGTYAPVGYRIRVTGRVCETTDGDACIHDIRKIELFQVK
jgi:uncharacterized RDD family membrane protein YckC